jgi:hypothetical protein
MNHIHRPMPRLAKVAATLLPLFMIATAGVLPAAAAEETNKIAPELQVADGFQLAIPKAGFGQDYMFTASLIPQTRAATSTGLAGKIVRFELFPDGVDLYESTRGLVVTGDLPARRLLATFSIVSQDANRVVIDFNKGMHRVFTQTWVGVGQMDAEERDRVMEVPESRVFEMRQEDGLVIIRQSVQLRSRQRDEDLEARYEVRYFLSPYKPAALEGKEPSIIDNRYARFFETDGQIEPVTGRVSFRIARFDIRHPVTFYYSANTPSNYVEAVKDGILYWNLAFGKTIVQAAKAPDGVTAPNAKYNIIQWVPWDNAGGAYADALLDPLSGETEHGQAYITSVFAFYGRADARALLRTLEEMAEAKKDDKKNPASLRFKLPFSSSVPCCDMDPQEFAQQMAHGLQEVLTNDALTDEAVLRISQDYVREVVAHEVGHILGLRHNFAGSLDGTLSRKELDDWFKAYVTGKPTDAYTNKLTSSSVMDYNILQSAAFIGWRMRTLKEALPHDRASIAWGYFNSSEARDKKMLFGTDDDTQRYGDVRRFDYGPDPVVTAYADMAETINLLPNAIIETFIRARTPRNTNDRVPLEQVNLSSESYARQLASQFSDMLSWFRKDTRSLRIEHQFDFVGDLNQKERYQAHWKYLNTQLAELGGVDRSLFSFLPLDLKLDLKQEPTNMPVVQRLNTSNLTARLEKLLDSTNYKTFVGLDDKKTNFTKEEHDLIIQRGKVFFDQLEKETVKQVCLHLEDAPRNLGIEANGSVGEDDAVTKLEQRIIELAKIVVMAKKDETNRISGKLNSARIEVVEFKYDQETRLAAAKALNERTGSFKSWAEDAKSDLNGDLKKDVEASLQIDHLKDFKVSQLSRPLREWYQEQQDILALLPAIPK